MLNILSGRALQSFDIGSSQVQALPPGAPATILKFLDDWVSLGGITLPCVRKLRASAPPADPSRLVIGVGHAGSGRKPADLVWLESADTGDWPFSPPVAGQSVRRSFPPHSATRIVDILKAVIATRTPHYVEVTEWTADNRAEIHRRLALPVENGDGRIELLMLWERAQG